MNVFDAHARACIDMLHGVREAPPRIEPVKARAHEIFAEVLASLSAAAADVDRSPALHSHKAGLRKAERDLAALRTFTDGMFDTLHALVAELQERSIRGEALAVQAAAQGAPPFMGEPVEQTIFGKMRDIPPSDHK